MTHQPHIQTMSSEQNQAPQSASYPPPMPIRTLRQGVNVAFRQVLAVSGAGMLVLSVPVGIATPFLPFGLPMAVIGAVLLGRNAVWGRRWMESVMTRHPRIEKMAPNWLMTQVFGRKKRAFTD